MKKVQEFVNKDLGLIKYINVNEWGGVSTPLYIGFD